MEHLGRCPLRTHGMGHRLPGSPDHAAPSILAAWLAMGGRLGLLDGVLSFVLKGMIKAHLDWCAATAASRRRPKPSMTTCTRHGKTTSWAPTSSTGPLWTWTMTWYARSTKSPRDTHFAAAHQTQAIRKLVGKALAALAVDHSSTSTAADAAGGTASSSQPDSAEPRYREGLTVIGVALECHPPRINAEMLATRDLVDAVTLRATLLAACYHTADSAHVAQLIGGPLRVNPSPGAGPDLHSRQYAWTRSDASGRLSSFERVFVDDAGQLETVKTLTGNVGHRLYAAFKANAHRADIFHYVDHYLRGGLYLDIKTALLESASRNA